MTVSTNPSPLSALPLPPDALATRLAFADLPVIPALRAGLDGRHLLLTGATGFFGRWLLALLHELQRQGTAIRVTAVSRQPAHFLSRHPAYRDCPWLDWVAGDVRSLPGFSGKLDLVLHAATDTSRAAGERPLELFDSIVGGSRRVLELATEHGARRVLLTGSGAQYGALTPGQPVVESSLLACDSSCADNGYGEAKRAQEMLAVLHAQRSKMDVVLTRCFAFSGPGLPLDGHFAMGNLVRDAIHGQAIVLQSAGEAVRSYLDGADLAAWLLFLLLHGEAGRAYNVGSDQALSVAELARRVIARLAPGKPLHTLGAPGGPRSYYVPAIHRARSLGLLPWTSLDQSIDRMGQWARGEWT